MGADLACVLVHRGLRQADFLDPRDVESPRSFPLPEAVFVVGLAHLFRL